MSTATNREQRVLLTINEVAERLRVEPVSVRHLHQTGRLRGVRIGRTLKWRATDVDRFIAGDASA